jgi:hypothetical protein
MADVSRPTAPLADATETLWNSLLTQNLRLGLPKVAVAVAFHGRLPSGLTLYRRTNGVNIG